MQLEELKIQKETELRVQAGLHRAEFKLCAQRQAASQFRLSSWRITTACVAKYVRRWFLRCEISNVWAAALMDCVVMESGGREAADGSCMG